MAILWTSYSLARFTVTQIPPDMAPIDEPDAFETLRTVLTERLDSMVRDSGG